MNDLKRPSVFISYAHKDGTDFTRRLSFGLEMYVDVFWDKRLQAGEYPQQLKKQIINRDYFVFVMSPYSLREESWCQIELETAKQTEKSDKKIIPVQIYAEDYSIDRKLFDNYTCPNFVDDFEAGFRRITELMLGTSYSSWEYLAHSNNENLSLSLQNGLVPCLICKQLSLWLFSELLWQILKPDFEKIDPMLSIAGHPRTNIGFKAMIEDLLKLSAKNRNAGQAQQVTEWLNQIITYSETMASLKDSQHSEAGKLMYEIINFIYKKLHNDASAGRQSKHFIAWEKYFQRDVYEKLRERISYYADTSRKLY